VNRGTAPAWVISPVSAFRCPQGARNGWWATGDGHQVRVSYASLSPRYGLPTQSRKAEVAKAYLGRLGSAMQQPVGSIWHPHGGSGRLLRLLRRGRRGESIPLDLSYLNELDGCAVTETLPMPTPASDAHSPTTRSRVVLRVLPATHPTSGVGKTRDQAPDHTGPSGTNEKDGTRAWRDRRSASGSRPTTTR
jgi:hypothetical protein